LKVRYQDPGPGHSTQSLSWFLGQEGFWSEPIHHFFPELKATPPEELGAVVTALYEARKGEIQGKVLSYQAQWDKHEDLVNERFSAIFQMDVSALFNDLTCHITLNPISPRHLLERRFDVFYQNSPQGSVGSALHELTHFLWFHLWHQKHQDAYAAYEAPGLIWVLSEAVVEPILRDDALDRVNPYHKSGNAYPYFYDMRVAGRPLYEHLNALFQAQPMAAFMDSAYQFFIDNEKEIRSQMG
jgi:hypothetical protein